MSESDSDTSTSTKSSSSSRSRRSSTSKSRPKAGRGWDMQCWDGLMVLTLRSEDGKEEYVMFKHAGNGGWDWDTSNVGDGTETIKSGSTKGRRAKGQRRLRSEPDALGNTTSEGSVRSTTASSK